MSKIHGRIYVEDLLARIHKIKRKSVWLELQNGDGTWGSPVKLKIGKNMNISFPIDFVPNEPEICRYPCIGGSESGEIG